MWDYKHLLDGDGRLDGYMYYYDDDESSVNKSRSMVGRQNDEHSFIATQPAAVGVSAGTVAVTVGGGREEEEGIKDDHV